MFLGTFRNKAKKRKAKQGTVAIVGGGVIGLTTAAVLAEEGFDVSLFTHRRASETTSATAAAFWYPFQVGAMRKVWASSTYHYFRSLVGVKTAGVSVVKGVEYLDVDDRETQKEIDSHWWKRLPGVNYEYVPGEFGPFVFGKNDSMGKEISFTHSVEFMLPVINMKAYLAYLERELSSYPSTCVIEQLCETPVSLLESHRYVVNCTGYGAREFAQDSSVYFVSGQLVRLDSYHEESQLVWIHTGRFAQEPLYIVPRPPQELCCGEGRGDTILGGSLIQMADYSPSNALPPHNPPLCELIARRCRAVAPKIADAEAIEFPVGIRPCRPTVRVEWCDRYPGRVFHNYGHGGAGVSLSWGCATTVCNMLLDRVQSTRE